jgi:hypothetical protein
MSDRSDSDDGGAPPAAAHLRDWDEWEDDGGEDEDATRSLFSDTVLPSPEACFAHDAERHGFDIRQFRATVRGGGGRRQRRPFGMLLRLCFWLLQHAAGRTANPTSTHTPSTIPLQLSLDDYGTIRLINYIRKEVAAGADPLALLRSLAAQGPAAAAPPHPWSSDDYLTPHLPDDPLLGYDYDDEAAEEG